MIINKAYRFRLEPTEEQAVKLRHLLGSARFVWNQVLAHSFELFAKGERIHTNELVKYITTLKNNPDYEFLQTHANAVSLQQKVRDLGNAWSRFFDPKAHARLKAVKGKTRKPRFFTLADGSTLPLRPLMPRFKRKAQGNDSIRLVQFERYCAIEGNRVKLPNQIGFVKFRKSREILGTIKNVTISQQASHWYVSFGVEQEVEAPVHPSTSAVGIDMGVAKLVTTSEGLVLNPKNSYAKHHAKLAKLQRQLSKKEKFSQNWKKQQLKIQRLHHKIANSRQDYLHKITTALSKNHAMVAVEDLKVMNMTASTKGTVENPGRQVNAKSGLNKAILDQGWGYLVSMLGYKQAWLGGFLVKVNPQYTSQRCHACGHTERSNRRSQAVFKCVACHHQNNADINAACNILAAGHAVLSVEGGRSKSHPLKQKTSESREGIA